MDSSIINSLARFLARLFMFCTMDSDYVARPRQTRLVCAPVARRGQSWGSGRPSELALRVSTGVTESAPKDNVKST